MLTEVFICTPSVVVATGIKTLCKKLSKKTKFTTASSFEELTSLLLKSDKQNIIFDSNCIKFTDFESETTTKFLLEHKVILYSNFNKKVIYDLHRLNLQGYITDESSNDDFAKALESFESNQKFYTQKVVGVLIEMSMKHATLKAETKAHDDLSIREMEVFKLVTEGKTAQEIADQFNLSIHTVYTHRKNILKKLSCSSASELINYAYDKNIFR
jgi:DNA-binding NarL/FixJ family response regulator|tara:strand:- start:3200 stop:3841 length:642 start_codon:yes stop_codon:yes gene_type:complete